MALKIFWTKEALLTYDRVIDYLTENWTEKEIDHFTERVEQILHLLSVENVNLRALRKRAIMKR